MKPSPRPRPARGAAARALALATLSTLPAPATSFYWDANTSTAGSGGSGTWDTSNKLWSSSTSSYIATSWASSGTNNDAYFGGTAGTVTLNASGITANDLFFTTHGYTLTGGTLTLNGTTSILSVASTHRAAVNTVMAGTSNLSKTGTGTLLLAGANTHTGKTAITAGTLHYTTRNAFYNGNTSLWTTSKFSVANGATATFNVGGTGEFTAEDIAIIAGLAGATSGFMSGSSINIDTSNATNNIFELTAGFSNVYVGLIKSGNGTLVLTGENIFFGNTIITEGTLNLANSNALAYSDLNLSGAGAVFFESSLDPYILGGLSGSGPLNGNGNLLIIAESTADTIYSGSLSNASLTKTGPRKLTLSGTNLYEGVTTVEGGTLQFGKRVALYNGQTAAWTAEQFGVSGGAVAAFNVGGTGEFTSSDLAVLLGLGTETGGFLSGSVAGLDTSNAAGGVFTHSLAIADPNSGGNPLGLLKTGSNVLVLSGGNAYSGWTSVSEGTLRIQHGTALGNAASGTLVASGATLALSGGITVADESLELAGAGIGGLAGALRSESGSNQWLGTGDLRVGNAAVNETVIHAAAGTLTLGGSGVIESLEAGAGQWLVLDGAAEGRIARVIQDGADLLGLVKRGSGLWELSAANLHSGNTVVEAGTLRLSGDGSLASSPVVVAGHAGSTGAVLDVSPLTEAFVVGTGQTLKGIGTVTTGSEAISIAGVLAPGNSAGILTIDGDLHLTGTGMFEWELNSGASGSRGDASGEGGYDGVNLSGTLSADPGATFQIVLLTGSFTDPFWESNQQWDDIFMDGTGSSVLAGWTSAFAVIRWFAGGVDVTGDLAAAPGSFRFTGADGTGTGHTLYWVAAPEPANGLVAGLAVAGALRRHRRQDRSTLTLSPRSSRPG